MKVFVAGATGVLGRRVVGQLCARGHTVLGLVRSDQGEKTVRSLGGEARRADLFDTASLARAAAGAQAVIHAATAIPTKARPSAADWAMNDRIRREGTRALCDAAVRIGARHFILQSIVWVARPSDDAPFDETSPPNPDPVTQSAYDAERIAREKAQTGAIRTAVLRCGSFFAPDARHTRMLGEAIARRRLPIIGDGDAVWACIHADDAASAFVAAAEAGRGGLWHVVDDQPVVVKNLLTALAALLGAPPPRTSPSWLARLVAGSRTVEFFTRSTRTSNARFRADIGWIPLFSSYREALRQIVSAWRMEGFPGIPTIRRAA